MKSLAAVKAKDDVDLVISKIRALDPSVVFLFMARAFFEDRALMEKLSAAFGPTPVIGCSTSGEISADAVHDDKIAFLALAFEQTRVKAVSMPYDGPLHSQATGEAVSAALAAEDLKAIFVLSPGLNMNGSALVRGLYAKVAPDVVISGGLAGDGVQFQKTYTYCNGAISETAVVAVGFYGDAIEVTTGSDGGWRPFGPARHVTRAEGHILYELDHRPALDLYDEYIGTQDKDSPASRLAYPLAILREDRSSAGLIRSALGVDRDKNALILAGDLPEGSLVCLMHAETDGLIQGAAQAATEAIRVHKARRELGVAILVSCVGRRLVMSLDTEEEIEAVRDSFDEGMTFSGFYAYGEICPLSKSRKPELHNQTMTVTFITEKKSTA